MSETGGGERAWMPWAAVLGALALALLRVSPAETHDITFLSVVFQRPDTLLSDPNAQVTLGILYTLVPVSLAKAVAWLGAAFGIPPDWPIGALNVLLWAVEARLMYLLAREWTGSGLAALLATWFLGLEVQLTPNDAPYSLQCLDRSTGMVPFLWGMLRLSRGDPWGALAGLAAATYVHASPAIYVWPVVIFEELWRLRDPGARAGVAMRLALAAAAALPLAAGVSGAPFPAGDPEYVRMNLSLHGPWIGGFDMSRADYLLMLEGLALIGMAAWRCRAMPGFRFHMRACGVCCAMLAFGTATWLGWVPGLLWVVSVKMQVWIGLYIIELAGHMFLARWLAAELEEGSGPWPAVLLMLAMAWSHDFVLRGAAAAIAALMLAGRPAWSAAVLAGLLAVPAASQLAPDALQRLAAAAGLRGGIFALPVFTPWMAVAIVFAAGLWLAGTLRRGLLKGWAAAAAAAAIMASAALPRWASTRMGEGPAWPGMADWVRENTPAGSIIFASPINIFGGPCRPFITRAERSVLACIDYAHGAIIFGGRSALMAERLRLAGVDPGRVGSEQGWLDEVRRADLELAPEKAAKLASAGRAHYLLIRAGRPWPGAPERVAGELALYRLQPTPASTPEPPRHPLPPAPSKPRPRKGSPRTK